MYIKLINLYIHLNLHSSKVRFLKIGMEVLLEHVHIINALKSTLNHNQNKKTILEYSKLLVIILYNFQHQFFNLILIFNLSSQYATSIGAHIIHINQSQNSKKNNKNTVNKGTIVQLKKTYIIYIYTHTQTKM